MNKYTYEAQSEWIHSEKKKAGSKIDLKHMAEAVFTLIVLIAFYLVGSAIDSEEGFYLADILNK